MLAGIEGKDLGPKFFLGIDLGVLQGQFSGGLFSDSIFDPSMIGANVAAMCNVVLIIQRLGSTAELIKCGSPSERTSYQTSGGLLSFR